MKLPWQSTSLRSRIPALVLTGLMIVSSSASGQDWLEPDLRVDWSHAGLEGALPDVTDRVDFLKHGGVADGRTDNAPALQALIDSIDSDTVIYLPEGDYLFNSPVQILARPGDPAIILRGAGWDGSRLIFDIPESGWTGLLDISGERSGDPIAVVGELKKGSLSIEVEDASGIESGANLILSQDNNQKAMDTAHRGQMMPERHYESLKTWGKRSVGQFLQVTGKSGNTLFLKHPLNLTFDWGGATVQEIDACQNVGLENFSLVNKSNVNDLDSIQFSMAANCWVRGIHSYHTVRIHVSMASSRNILVSGNFLDNSFRHGGGGHGYGVVCSSYTNDCLITNNIFRRLRHSVMIKQGANANVFSYIYSFDGFQEGAIVAKDISVHGHYPFMNLFEGNVVQYVHCADYWGSAGPGNTFYRNQVTTVGIKLQDYSPGQIVVANEVPNDPFGLEVLTLGGGFRMKNHIAIHSSVADDPLAFANATQEDPPGKSGRNLPSSLYLESPPDFWPEGLAWPAFGPPAGFGIHQIPAQLRWETIADAHARPMGLPFLAVDWSLGWENYFWREGSQKLVVKNDCLAIDANKPSDATQGINSTLWSKVTLPDEFFLEAEVEIISADNESGFVGLIIKAGDPEEQHLFDTTKARISGEMEGLQALNGVFLPVVSTSGEASIKSLKGMPLTSSFDVPSIHSVSTIRIQILSKDGDLTLRLNGETVSKGKLGVLPNDGFFALVAHRAIVNWKSLEVMALR